MSSYKYGMRLRGFSPGCQPKMGFVERQDDPTGKYYDILVYNRALTAYEVREFELDIINPIKALRARTGLTQQRFADAYSIPKRTIENWESGVNEPPIYVLKLLDRVIREDFK